MKNIIIVVLIIIATICGLYFTIEHINRLS